MPLNVKMKRDPTIEYSRGEYYLRSGTTIDFNCPVQYYGGVASRTYGGTARGGKLEVYAYASNNGTEPCPGIAMESIIDNTATPLEISAGFNVAREISLMRKGYTQMVYQAGATVGGATSALTPYYGMRIAPAVAGFQQWRPGMFSLGIFADEISAQTLSFSNHASTRTFRVHIDVMASEAAEVNTLAEMTDVTITAAADGDILKHDGTAWVDSPHTLTNVSDVTITSLAAGNIVGASTTSAFANLAVKSELLASPVTTGDNHVFTASSTPLVFLNIFETDATQEPIINLIYDATATVPTLKYNWTGTSISTNKATDGATHLYVTYLYTVS